MRDEDDKHLDVDYFDVLKVVLHIHVCVVMMHLVMGTDVVCTCTFVHKHSTTVHVCLHVYSLDVSCNTVFYNIRRC